MNKFSLTDIMAEISDYDIPEVEITARAGNGPCVFSLVYAKGNSKRISISKSLAEALDIDKVAYLLAIPDKNIILISKVNIAGKAVPVKLSGDGKKLGYNASVALMLVKAFKLNYEKCTSKSFKDIAIEVNDDGVSVAIITMTDPDPFKVGDVA